MSLDEPRADPAAAVADAPSGVVVLVEHLAEDVSRKIIDERALALTGCNVVDRTITDLTPTNATPSELSFVDDADEVADEDGCTATGSEMRVQPAVVAG